MRTGIFSAGFKTLTHTQSLRRDSFIAKYAKHVHLISSNGNPF